MEGQKFKLTIELVPSTVWYSSIFQIYKKSKQLNEWKSIKRELFVKEGMKCWICGAENTRLEAHEFWEYDDESRVQRLVAIHHLCSMCHKIKHVGLWFHTLYGFDMLEKYGPSQEDLIDHFCKVNNCSREEFKNHKEEAFRIWRERSKYEWKQDFGEYVPNRILIELKTVKDILDEE